MAVLAAALLLSGCASGGSATSDTPRRDLAGRPQSALPQASAGHATASSVATRVPARTATPGATRPRASDPGATAPAAGGPARTAAFRTVGSLTDARADQGVDGPSYADVVAVQVADDGTHARVTVVLGGRLPSRTAARESLGLGVDLYATRTAADSDYQLFADGEPDGWFAYLETPKGFVRYPGTFAVGADRVVFTVPWSSLGGRRSGWFSCFADWTQGGRTGVLGGNASSQDRAPALGSAAYSR